MQIGLRSAAPSVSCLTTAVFCALGLPTGFAQTHPVAEALKPFIDRHVLAGAVTLVANKDKILDLETAGFADIAAGKPMETNTLFWIASQSKPMTSTALMMLVDDGKVNVDDPVEKYLPEFKGQMVAVERDADHVLLRKPAHPPKLRELLSHTSGLPFKSPLEEPTLDMLPLRDAVRSYALLPLQFEPGTKYQYSNAGINTAARIIEVVSGIAYEDFMQQRLFDPLGMKDTTFKPTEDQVRRIAKSYKPKSDPPGLEEITVTQLHYPLTDPKRQPMPAGGLFSSAFDVGRFCQMILNNGTFEGKRYLSEAAAKQMTSKQTGEGITDAYGFGWFTSANGSFGHGGAYSTNLSIEPQRNLITVFLVQHAGFAEQEGPAIQKAFTEGVARLLGK
jgi:CubicO group peptidase (beta-lactamase class C family)